MTRLPYFEICEYLGQRHRRRAVCRGLDRRRRTGGRCTDGQNNADIPVKIVVKDGAQEVVARIHRRMSRSMPQSPGQKKCANRRGGSTPSAHAMFGRKERLPLRGQMSSSRRERIGSTRGARGSQRDCGTQDETASSQRSRLNGEDTQWPT